MGMMGVCAPARRRRRRGTRRDHREEPGATPVSRAQLLGAARAVPVPPRLRAARLRWALCDHPGTGVIWRLRTFRSGWVYVGSCLPTVLRIAGLRVVIYPNDHPPAHVHVLGPGWVVVVDLTGPGVREVIGCDEREARLVLRQIADRRAELMDARRRFHG